MKKKIINKLKQNKKIIIESIIIFTLTLLFNLICSNLTHDELWNYGFAHNIANGLIPYKDFNMITPPLYPLLGAIFLLVFGNSLLSYNIFNAIICTIMYHLIKKQTPKYYLIVYGIFLSFALPNYNVFSLFLLYLLITLDNKKEDKKINDYLIGFLIGLSFLTNQIIGIILCITILFTKNVKSILKRFIGFIIPIIIILIYLLVTNTISQFIDYTFLGMISHITENFKLDKGYIILLILSIIYLIYKYIKTKDIKNIYLLCFQTITIPMLDSYHIMLAFIPVLAEILNDLKLPRKLINIGFGIFITIIFSYNIYLLNTNCSFPNESNLFKYKKVNNDTLTALVTMREEINKIEDDLYIISTSAYMLKLETNREINKYDLLNNGYLGKEGIEPIIDEIDELCNDNKCAFLLDDQEINGNIDNQFNKEIIEHITRKYYYKDTIEGTSIKIYKNY